MSVKKLCYGTWQFEDAFKKVSRKQAIELLEFALEMGIENFDTALVYGNGDVERILSEVETKGKNIITKIPAKQKPTLQEVGEIGLFYDKEWINQCVSKSVENLKRTPTVFLLHNWSDYWLDSIEILNYLRELKRNGACEYIGISLPNDYNGILGKEILSIIDFIEAPYNFENNWIKEQSASLNNSKLKIITRSLFKQGNLLRQAEGTLKNDYLNKTINEAASFSDYVAIGMTSKAQIEHNIKQIKKEGTKIVTKGV
ncbi:aldo/keto reductase [Bacillus thuringiensis]|uniref:aldo/keto reductase n=1 Tax=Bacillus cereus group TaxID=86661 RepID=UPI000BF68306|nr:aldo/keto reductase [Bacillus thuringiensis]PFJ10035.1 hypothetical protein COI87_19705 [Bacillus thuringiensis]PGX85641.1 hypothetical protein COE45_04330 [Bacillus thuringiensis]HDR8064192.1 aldo/keto reductase [Bacillus cereus]